MNREVIDSHSFDCRGVSSDGSHYTGELSKTDPVVTAVVNVWNDGVTNVYCPMDPKRRGLCDRDNTHVRGRCPYFRDLTPK